MFEAPDLGTLAIRPAAAADVPVLLRLIHPFVEAGKLLERTEAELGVLVSSGFVAEVQGRIVGFAALEIYSLKLAELRSLAVAPEYQGQGIGRRLVQACVELARARNVLEVMAITSSEGVFRACGFDYTLPGEKKALFVQTRENDRGATNASDPDA